MFNKKIKISVDNNGTPNYDVKDLPNYFSIIPKNFPLYFNTIPKTIYNSKLHFFNKQHRTIKTCAGFINLFKRSILVRSPLDIQVIFNDTQIEIINVGVEACSKPVVTQHDNIQLLDYVPHQEKYKMIIKINFWINIDPSVSLLMHNPWYHFLKTEICPGILPKNYNGNLNFFIPIEKNKKELLIRQGDPLFMLTPLTESSLKLTFEKKEVNHIFHPTFSLLKKYILNNVIK